jgi:hypothetical protein
VAPRPWEGVGEHTLAAFIGWNALYQVGGVGATVLMVNTGIDREVHQFFAEHTGVGCVGLPGMFLGYAAPVAAVGGFYLASVFDGSSVTAGAGAAVLQAVTLNLAYTTLLKAVAGRPPPPAEGRSSAEWEAGDPSKRFRFGFGRGGVYHGWPSGHTAAAVSVGVTLAAYYDAWWVDVLAYAGVGYMMFSVVAFESGSVHWASDAVAAALMTFPIARSVGLGFRRKVHAKQAPDAALTPSVLPVLTADGAFLTVGARF